MTRTRDQEKAMFRRIGAGSRSAASHKAWQTRYAQLPKVSLAQLRRTQAERPPRSQVMDRRRTSHDLIAPDSPRTNYWLNRPGAYDVKGMDDQQTPPKRPRPAKPASATRPNVRPMPVRPAAKPATRPPIRSAAPPTPTQASSPAVRGWVASVTKRMRDLLPRSSSKTPPPASRQEIQAIDSRMKAAFYGQPKPEPKQGPDQASIAYDVGKGGLLLNAENTLGIFNPSKKALPQPVLAKLKAQGVKIGNVPNMGDKYTDLLAGDLQAYLKGIDPERKAAVAPVGESLFDAKLLRQLAAAFTGPVQIHTGRDCPMMVVKGNRAALIAPRIGDDGSGPVEEFVKSLQGAGQKPPIGAEATAPSPPATKTATKMAAKPAKMAARRPPARKAIKPTRRA